MNILHLRYYIQHKYHKSHEFWRSKSKAILLLGLKRDPTQIWSRYDYLVNPYTNGPHLDIIRTHSSAFQAQLCLDFKKMGLDRSKANDL